MTNRNQIFHIILQFLQIYKNIIYSLYIVSYKIHHYILFKALLKEHKYYQTTDSFLKYFENGTSL